MKFFYSLFLLCILFTCSAQETKVAVRDTLSGEIITVPVVIHILYNNDAQNISDAQAASQVESLNKDYRKLNNLSNIPTAFSSLAGDAKIVFCLAKTDPKGKLTNGLLHKFTTTKSWSADDAMKFSGSGGDNAWDAKKYLNIWVCNLSGSNLGYSSLPGSPLDKDGVVIQFDVFGTTGHLRAPFNKGRTATHEIGHWLGLMHLWGDVLCGDDKIDDTPPQRSYNNGLPSFPQLSTCSINANGDMFMDFMDFTDDACMSMFTHGQVNKMRSLFAAGGARNSFLSSFVCNSPTPEARSSATDSAVITKTGASAGLLQSVSLYPNPARDFVYIESNNGLKLPGKTLIIYNMTGIEVKRQILLGEKNTILINTLSAGIYTVKIGEGKEIKVLRLVKR